MLAMMSLAGGMIYLPADGDSNAYRIPRVLEWLGAGQWHWIGASDIRLDIAGCGFEWLTAPLILFTHSFRLIFLANWISYLLLPGLVFSVFTRLRVRPRVAWWWMWLLPAGWCYAMQASSVCNDSFAAVYAMAAVDLALRARERNNISDLWLALLAAALLTGAKQTMIPLTVVCLAAIVPAMKLLWTRPAGTIAVGSLAVLVSAAPLMFFNHQHTGLWLGIPPNTGPTAMFWARCQPDSPFWGIIGNAICLPVQNLEPPIFPWADHWNNLMKQFLQTPFGAHFVSFEDFGLLGRALTEGTAGIGLGIVILTAISLVWPVRSRQQARPQMLAGWIHLLRWTPWLALLIFMAKVGSHSNARQLSAYYVFFFPLLLSGARQSSLVKKRWWQWLALGTMALTALLLVAARNRPLFPAQATLRAFQAAFPQVSFWSKIDRSYAYWRSMRTVVSNPFKENIPVNEATIGYATVFGFAEPGLWLPWRQHTVIRLSPGEPVAALRQKGIRYIVVGDEFIGAAGLAIEDWLKANDAELVSTTTYDYSPEGPRRQLFLVRLRG